MNSQNSEKLGQYECKKIQFTLV